MDSIRRRKAILIGLGVAALSLLLGLAALNAFRLSFLSPSSVGQIFLFTTVSFVAFLLFLTALLLLVRNALRLYAEQRSGVLGARLRTRMLWYAVLLSLLPVTAMFGFSYLLMNRAVERWFSQPAADLRDDSSRIALDLSRYVVANARAEASSIAETLSARKEPSREPVLMDRDLRSHEATLQGGFVVVFQDGVAVTRFQVPAGPHDPVLVRPWEFQSDENGAQLRTAQGGSVGPLDETLLRVSQDPEESLLSLKGSEYLLGGAWHQRHALVVVALPLPAGLNSSLEHLRRDGDQYWTLFQERHLVRRTYMLIMFMITSLVLFCVSWLALHLSKQVTRPVEALAGAMNAVAGGDYERRVDTAAAEELGELAAVFNSMAAELAGSRRFVEQSTVQVLQANTALELRRRELETMLQTIPNGVVMLDPQRRIRVANRAFSEMLDPGGQRSFVGEPLAAVLPPDAMEPLDRLLQRSHRMSAAAGELEMDTAEGTLHISATVALLDSASATDRNADGYVLVLENATELLRAQKQAAWKEVARRVAHEIKNPLTPISLGAEQIRRHIGRIADLLRGSGLESPSTATIHRSSEVISSSVDSMRSLVDQFSALAEFPNAHPRPADLNTVVDNTLALFAGRLQNIQITRSFARRLPLAMVDPEAIKRALSNLIDNAAEAMTTSLHREIHVATRMAADAESMVELVVADTGPGVTDEMRERLFLPYFSTKQRGSGLGLTIAAKIVADHRGTIRVEKNSPTGARFLIDLPVAIAEAAMPAEATAPDTSLVAEPAGAAR